MLYMKTAAPGLHSIPYPRLACAIALPNAVGLICAILLSLATNASIPHWFPVLPETSLGWFVAMMLPLWLGPLLTAYGCVSNPRPPMALVILIPVSMGIWETLALVEFYDYPGIALYMEHLIIQFLLPSALASLAVCVGLSRFIDWKRREQPRDRWFYWAIAGAAFFAAFGFFLGVYAVQQLKPPELGLRTDFSYGDAAPSLAIAMFIALFGFVGGALLYWQRERQLCVWLIERVRLGRSPAICGFIVGMLIGLAWYSKHYSYDMEVPFGVREIQLLIQNYGSVECIVSGSLVAGCCAAVVGFAAGNVRKWLPRWRRANSPAPISLLNKCAVFGLATIISTLPAAGYYVHQYLETNFGMINIGVMEERSPGGEYVATLATRLAESHEFQYVSLAATRGWRHTRLNDMMPPNIVAELNGGGSLKRILWLDSHTLAIQFDPEPEDNMAIQLTSWRDINIVWQPPAATTPTAEPNAK